MSAEVQERPLRHIRSFVRRPGRLTPAQEKALKTRLAHYQFNPSAPWPQGDVVMEIGFGNGQALVEMAQAQHNVHFIGVEVHPPGVGRLLNALDGLAIDNVSVAMSDVVELLKTSIPDQGLAEVRIYFPDPWPKKKHHKRRLIQPEFVALLAQKLILTGRIHLATDWMAYAEWMVEVFEQASEFERIDDPHLWRPKTHFERRGERRGHAIVDLVYQKTTTGPKP